MNNIKNKRGDITIAILVIGIVVVCFIALLSFYLAKLDTDDNFDGIGKMSVISSNMERCFSGKEVKIEPSDGRGKHLSEKIGKIFEVKYYLPK